MPFTLDFAFTEAQTDLWITFKMKALTRLQVSTFGLYPPDP